MNPVRYDDAGPLHFSQVLLSTRNSCPKHEAQTANHVYYKSDNFLGDIPATICNDNAELFSRV
jgi:hypothetical protein